ncbi:MAG: hypothetical protein WC889_02350 [Myxococcota bacterium]|jgi:hypothetical protein
MNPIVKSALAGLVVFVGLGAASAFAQDSSCTCATAYRGPGLPVGSISQVTGDVVMSQVAGYDSAKPGNALSLGSRVVVGPKGSALVQAGGCSLAVPANSSLDISRVGNNICLKVQGPGQAADSQTTGSVRRFRFGFPEAFFAGALITTGVLAATQDDDKGVSQ